MNKIIFIVLFIFVAFPLFAKDRCEDYIPDVRKSAIQYLGMDYPYYYNIGCMITETNCRSIQSFDGGIGIFQFTPSTGVGAEISKYMAFDPYNDLSSIRAQALYMSLIMKKFKSEKVSFKKHIIYPAHYQTICGNNLADYYRFYNGGFWATYESCINNDCVCDNNEMKKKCVRGGTWVGTGNNKRWLSFCEVNYSYPEKVYKYSQKYNNGMLTNYRFWYNKENKEVKPIVVMTEKLLDVFGVTELNDLMELSPLMIGGGK